MRLRSRTASSRASLTRGTLWCTLVHSPPPPPPPHPLPISPQVLATHAAVLLEAHEAHRECARYESRGSGERGPDVAPDFAAEVGCGEEWRRSCCSGPAAWGPRAVLRQIRWLSWRCVVQLAREPSLLRTQLVVRRRALS